jgi:hypothetical protein
MCRTRKRCRLLPMSDLLGGLDLDNCHSKAAWVDPAPCPDGLAENAGKGDALLIGDEDAAYHLLTEQTFAVSQKFGSCSTQATAFRQRFPCRSCRCGISGMVQFRVIDGSAVGASGGTRTPSLQVRSLLLYPLSYGRRAIRGRADRTMVPWGRGGRGFHPAIAPTQRRAFSLSTIPGKCRRSSTAAANSPLASNT